GRPAGQRDARRVVVPAGDQRRADAVGVDRPATLLEGVDALGGEGARDDNLAPLEAVAVERLTDLPDEPLVDAARLEVAHLVPERPVDELSRGVEPNTPEPRPEGTRNLERRLHGVVLEVDEDGDV